MKQDGAPTIGGRAVRSLSRDILEIDWCAHVPWVMDGGIRLELATLHETLEFMRLYYGTIFGADGTDHRFFAETLTPAKVRFLEASDRFAFREGTRTVGLLVGQPLDWSTYYWRTVAFVPEHQGRGLLSAALERTDAVMRDAGVVRVEGEAAPNNQRQLRLLIRLGYCVTGSVNSERWGTLLRLTRFLAPQAQECFVGQFCRNSFRTGTALESGLGMKWE